MQCDTSQPPRTVLFLKGRTLGLYVLTNGDSGLAHGYLKIGWTRNLNRRIFNNEYHHLSNRRYALAVPFEAVGVSDGQAELFVEHVLETTIKRITACRHDEADGTTSEWRRMPTSEMVLVVLGVLADQLKYFQDNADALGGSYLLPSFYFNVKPHAEPSTLEPGLVRLQRRWLARRPPKQEGEREGGDEESTAPRPTPDSRPGQRDALNAVVAHYEAHASGHIEQACGAGKALLSVFTVEAMHAMGMLQPGRDTSPPAVLWGVPSLHLLSQMIHEARRVFRRVRIAFLGSGGNVPSDAQRLQAAQDVAHFVTMPRAASGDDELRIVVTTYHSSHIVYDACETRDGEQPVRFAMKIGDECHHLVEPAGSAQTTATEEDLQTAGFGYFLGIPSAKSLFMTATTIKERHESDEFGEFDTSGAPDGSGPNRVGDTLDTERRQATRHLRAAERPATMDHPAFGKEIDDARRSVRWAIEHELITDYRLIVLRHTQDEIDVLTASLPTEPASWAVRVGRPERRAMLLMAAAQTVTAMLEYEGLTHALFFTSTIDEADVAVEMLRACAAHFGLAQQQRGQPTEECNSNHASRETGGVYVQAVHTRSTQSIGDTMAQARRARQAIIPCCGMFKEGVDEPRLNGVVAATPMHSHLGIVQSLTRGNRKDAVRQPNKVAHILLPVLDDDDAEYDGRTAASSSSWDGMFDVLHSLRRYDDAMCSRIEVRTRHASGNGARGACDARGALESGVAALEHAELDDEDGTQSHTHVAQRFKLRMLRSLQVRAGSAHSKRHTLQRFCRLVLDASRLHSIVVHSRKDYRRLQQAAQGLVDEPPGSNASGTGYAEFGWQMVCTQAGAYYPDAEACMCAVKAIEQARRSCVKPAAGCRSGSETDGEETDGEETSETEEAEFVFETDMVRWHDADPRIPPDLRCFYPKEAGARFRDRAHSEAVKFVR